MSLTSISFQSLTFELPSILAPRYAGIRWAGCAFSLCFTHPALSRQEFVAGHPSDCLLLGPFVTWLNRRAAGSLVVAKDALGRC